MAHADGEQEGGQDLRRELSGTPVMAIIESVQRSARITVTSGSTTPATRRKSSARKKAIISTARPVKRAMSRVIAAWSSCDRTGVPVM